MANKFTYGEMLFAEYLTSQNIKFEHEPELPGIRQLFDFVIDHPEADKILLDVKDIENAPMPKRSGAFSPYTPIRSHIEAGKKKFKNAKDYLCALVLVAPPISLAMLESPVVMLGAMYGNHGYIVPLDAVTGEPHRDQIRAEFLVGDGQMLRKNRVQSTRIAALITVHEYKLLQLTVRKYINTEDGRTRAERYADVRNGHIDLPDEDAIAVGVTVWENGLAAKKLPKDLFRGEMDAWWESDGSGEQRLTFIGDRRMALRGR